MAIPTGYEKLAVIGIAYKCDYVDGTAYKQLNAVYYNGATYVALKDDPITPPVADGVNWQYLAKGFTDGVLSAIEAIDTSGLIGQAGATVGAQILLDVIADKVATKLLAKNQVVNNLLATIPGNALDACQGKALMDLINQQNSDIKYTDISFTMSTGASEYAYKSFDYITPDGYIPQSILLMRDTPANSGFGSSASISAGKLLIECRGFTNGTFNGIARIYFVRSSSITQ